MPQVADSTAVFAGYVARLERSLIARWAQTNGVPNMATIEVTVPETIMLGRNGSIGSLKVDWSHVPQNVLDHIASVYFPQYLTDAANAGGRDESPAERLAPAGKKLGTMLA